MKFHTSLLQIGNNVGVHVPDEVVEALGAGKKPPVVITINDDYTWRSSVAVMGGKYLVSFSSAHRTASGYKGGDDVEITIEVDDAPRTVEVPEALQAAMDAAPGAQAAFDTRSNSRKKLLTVPVADAKTDETRDKRIARAIAELTS
jgi:hypothetical protein